MKYSNAYSIGHYPQLAHYTRWPWGLRSCQIVYCEARLHSEKQHMYIKYYFPYSRVHYSHQVDHIVAWPWAIR